MRELQAGVSQAALTAPVGEALIGPEAQATGVHDPLYVQALVLSQGPQRAALVCADLVGMDLALADGICGRIREELDLPLTLINCSHTHSAPYTIPWGRGWRQEGQAWRRELAETVVATVARAAGEMQPVRPRAGRAPAQVGLNRRLPTTEDGVVMQPNPAGACVPWVDVLRADRADGSPLAILLSHAAHPVIVHGASTLISADYPGYARQAVAEHFGEGVQVMFAQGCGANINGEPLRGGFEAAERAGKALAKAAIRAAAESEPLEPGELRQASATVALPFEEPPSVEECRRELRQAEEELARAEGSSGDGGWREVSQYLRDVLGKAERGERAALRFEVHGLALGKAWCLLAMPHEVFAEYQLYVEEASPFPHKMVWAYTNGCESYIPTARDLELGGYETAAWPRLGAPLMYHHRLALRPEAERLVRKCLDSVVSELCR